MPFFTYSFLLLFMMTCWISIAIESSLNPFRLKFNLSISVMLYRSNISGNSIVLSPLLVLMCKCNEITLYYRTLKVEITKIELDFENAVRYYRSPMRQGLNDISIIYNSMKNIKGPMGDFEKVSVYIHGIESNGNEFLESAKKASVEGDVIVHVKRNGKKEYFVVKTNEYGDKEIITLKDFQSLQNENAYKFPDGRFHLVYDTEQSNEHRHKSREREFCPYKFFLRRFNCIKHRLWRKNSWDGWFYKCVN